MKHFGQVISYLRKNFWLPVAVMIIPSIAACVLSTPYWEVSFVAAYNYDPYVSVGETFRIMFGDSWQYLWPVIVVSALQIVAASLLTSAIDRHFRTGKLSLANPLQLLNNSIFPTFLSVLIMCVFSIIWRFVLFGLVLLVRTIGMAAGIPASVTLAVISVIAIAMFTVHVLALTPMLFWSPIMFIYGYRFGDAAATSFKLLSGKRIFIKIFPPFLVCALIQLLVGFLQAPLWAMIVSGFVVALINNVYATVFTIVTFYRISDLDRRDVVKYEFSVPQTVIDAAKSDRSDKAEKTEKTDKVEKPAETQTAENTVKEPKQKKRKAEATTEKRAKKANAPDSSAVNDAKPAEKQRRSDGKNKGAKKSDKPSTKTKAKKTSEQVSQPVSHDVKEGGDVV